MSDSDFFEELQTEFLNESAFLLESYEEAMLGLENGTDPQSDLGQIFRVAHSVKGGAAAVGFEELSKFAHVMEDLLSLLRNDPSHVNSEIISLLLQSGDKLKQRVHNLLSGQEEAWETAHLVEGLQKWIDHINGAPSQKASTTAEGDHSLGGEAGESRPSMAPPEDLANHDLLAELAQQFGEEILTEAAGSPAVQSPGVASTPQPAVESKVQSPIQSQPQATVQAPVKDSDGKKNKPAVASIKVDTGRVDAVLDAVGELVVLKNQLVHDELVQNGAHARLTSIVDQIDKSVRDLYDKTLSIRMTPLKSLFLKIQRIVRDVSLTLDKPVNLHLVGEETEVERTVFELLGDPLVHLVRNAMDHGVEKQELRKERGKPVTAEVTVSAKQTGGSVVIEIIDDGGGISREKVLKKALEKGLVPAGVDSDSLPDEQVFQFIFAPGFSTADKVSDLSGRGVGLDVVKSNLEKINGKIDIKSKLGQGTTFRLSIPLSTAITDGILVAIESSKFILPIHSIREIVRATPEELTRVPGLGQVVKIREALLPVINIKKTIGKINFRNLETAKYTAQISQNSLRAQREETMFLVVESMHGQMALPVEDVIGQAQVVVKPLNMVHHIPEVAGAAILGDGRTVLILDPNTLLQQRMVEPNQRAAA